MTATAVREPGVSPPPWRHRPSRPSPGDGIGAKRESTRPRSATLRETSRETSREVPARPPYSCFQVGLEIAAPAEGAYAAAAGGCRADYRGLQGEAPNPAPVGPRATGAWRKSQDPAPAEPSRRKDCTPHHNIVTRVPNKEKPGNQGVSRLGLWGKVPEGPLVVRGPPSGLVRGEPAIPPADPLTDPGRRPVFG